MLLRSLNVLTPQIEVFPVRGINKSKQLKNAVWIYFILLIFEGALRKWFLPALATPLLIIRDPIALWLIIMAWYRGLLPANFYIVGMVLVGIIGTFTAIFLGHGSLPIAIYGARILLLHFPLMFVIGRVFNKEDVLRIGKVILWLSIPMALLVAIQFYSPQSDWVNRGVGGDMEGAGFSGAMGFYRAPATFSFTNGTALFFGLTACFIFYFWLTAKGINYLLLIIATLALLAVIPLSISRSLFFSVLVTFLFACIAAISKPAYLGKMLITVAGGLVLVALLSKTDFFSQAIEVFTNRFDNASDSEGGLEGTLGDRYLGQITRAVASSSDATSLGGGLGLGTNVATQLLTGERGFLIAEEEWLRLIGELGPLMGLAVIVIRIAFSLKVANLSFKKLLKGDVLPWMLLSFVLLNIPQGQWAQPTALGFSVFSGGLILASLQSNQKNKAAPRAGNSNN